MRYFSQDDLATAVAAMLSHADARNPSVLGTMSGIKRRARARAIVAFCEGLSPAPPDVSMTWMRKVQRRLFGRAVSHGDLHRHFATPGRKADDRVDQERFLGWLTTNQEAFQDARSVMLAGIEAEWGDFTKQAAAEAGTARRRQRDAGRKR